MLCVVGYGLEKRLLKLVATKGSCLDFTDDISIAVSVCIMWTYYVFLF